MMEQKPSALKALRIMYFTLLAGMVTFTAISYFISGKSEAPIPGRETYKILSIVLLIVAFICVVITANLFKRDLNRIRQLATAREKMNQYRVTAIRTWAMIEGATLLAAIFFFLTHHQQFLIFTGLLILIYLLYSPTANKIALQVNESVADIEKL
jgi:hypothetical protein